MKQVVLVVDIQASFSPPTWLVERAQEIANAFPSVATVERHNESRVPFRAQLNWAPAQNDVSLVKADHEFVKHGYAPTPQILDTIMGMEPDRVLVCGIQADTCVLAAGFALFDLGLKPTLIADTVVGSSLDRSGELGAKLWRHHFGAVIESYETLLLPSGSTNANPIS